MESETGITGPSHKWWNTMDVNTLPNQRCLICGSRFHTPGWCDAWWAQSEDAKDKGDLFAQMRQSRFVWNKPSEAQLSSLSCIACDAPTAAEAVSVIVHDDGLASFVDQCQPLASACHQVYEDDGKYLYALVAEWKSPTQATEQDDARLPRA